MSGRTRLGMTLMPEYLQNEGVAAVLHRVVDVAGASSITTVPSVMEPAATGGVREPPEDGGAGDRRVLDRPLWGRRHLMVRTAPSFVPNRALYSDSPYEPPVADELTHSQGGCVDDLVTQCHASGVECWLQLMAASPPGVRVQSGGPMAVDMPMPPRPEAALARVDRNASLASPGIRAFMKALIADVARAYPKATGLKFDWPEYPPYEFRSLFFDYNPAAASVAAANGIDFAALRHDMAALLERLPELASHGEHLAALLRRHGLVELLAGHNVLAQHFRLRALLVADYATFLADCVRPTGMKLFLQGFPPPWNFLSGFDPTALDGLADGIGIKLYTMHWPMIERNTIDRLAELGAGPAEALAPLVQLALEAGGEQARPYQAIRYPDPHEPHPAGDATIIGKLSDISAKIRTSEFWALAHAYGPIADVERRLRAALSVTGNIQMNRYGYLSDEKLALLGRVTRER